MCWHGRANFGAAPSTPSYLYSHTMAYGYISRHPLPRMPVAGSLFGAPYPAGLWDTDRNTSAALPLCAPRGPPILNSPFGAEDDADAFRYATTIPILKTSQNSGKTSLQVQSALTSAHVELHRVTAGRRRTETMHWQAGVHPGTASGPRGIPTRTRARRRARTMYMASSVGPENHRLVPIHE